VNADRPPALAVEGLPGPLILLACLALALFGCIEGVKPTRRTDAPPAQPAGPTPTPAPAPPEKDAPLAWGATAEVGDWRVELKSFDARSNPAQLRLAVGNASASRTLRYPGLFWGGARLRDERGKEYPVFNFGTGRSLKGQATMPVRIPPRSRIDDLVLFRPVPRASGPLILEIDPAIFGKRLRFRIPAPGT
jgi:hypothetical protein